MLRFVIRRKMLDRYNGLASEGIETVDADCHELESVLVGGGTDMDCYDYRELVGVEVLQAAEPVPQQGPKLSNCTKKLQANGKFHQRICGFGKD
jgi:hypothetical protein